MEQPQLTSSDGPGVYFQQVLQLECISDGSILSWRTNEYLNGDGGELAFTLGHSPGEIMEFGGGVVVAVLDAINGSTLHSTLNIVVSAVHLTFTVSCYNPDSGRISNKTFHLIGKCSILKYCYMFKYSCNVVDLILLDEPAVIVTAESTGACDLRFDCEVRDSLTM